MPWERQSEPRVAEEVMKCSSDKEKATEASREQRGQQRVGRGEEQKGEMREQEAVVYRTSNFQFGKWKQF